MSAYLRIDHSGQIEIDDEVSRVRLSERPGAYQPMWLHEDMLLLQRMPEEQTPSRPQVLMMGEIVDGSTLTDVLSAVANARWSGEFQVQGMGERKSLWIDQGMLCGMYSDRNEERLGELLMRYGALDAESLRIALRQQSSGERLGETLLRHGLLNEQELEKCLRRQTEIVFFSALSISQGHYCFLKHEGISLPEPVSKFPLELLLLQAMQRSDELQTCRALIPHLDLYPQMQGCLRVDNVSESEQELLRLCDGSQSLKQLAEQFGLDEFEITRSAYHLVKQGYLVVHEERHARSEAAQRLLRHYNSVLRDIFVAAATYGALIHLREHIIDWLSGNDYQDIFGNEIGMDGPLEPYRVIAAWQGMSSEHRIEELDEILHQLVELALSYVSAFLPEEQQRSLECDVQRKLTKIKAAT